MSNRYVTSSSALVCVALGGAVLISAVFVLVLGLPTGLPRWCDFRIYYAAAHTYFVDAGNPYLVDRPFPFVYSYLWLWLLRPLLAVSLDTAAVIVLGIAVVMLFMTMVLIARATHIDELPSKQLAMITALVVLGNQMPLAVALRALNAEVVCGLLISLAMVTAGERGFGVFVGAAAALKPHYALFAVPGLIFERKVVPLLIVGLTLLLVDVIPFVAHPDFVSGFLKNISFQSLEHGHPNPSIAALLTRLLHLNDVSGRTFFLFYFLAASVSYAVTFHRPWGRLSPEGRWLATLLYFLLVTPRLKDYSLHLFFFPVFCTLRDAARTGTVVGKRLVVMFGVVGVTWFIAYMVLKDPGFLRFILGIISVANLVIVLAMLLRLLHAGFARPGFVATAAARNRPIAAEAEPQGVNSEG